MTEELARDGALLITSADSLSRVKLTARVRDSGGDFPHSVLGTVRTEIAITNFIWTVHCLTITLTKHFLVEFHECPTAECFDCVYPSSLHVPTCPYMSLHVPTCPYMSLRVRICCHCLVSIHLWGYSQQQQALSDHQQTLCSLWQEVFISASPSCSSDSFGCFLLVDVRKPGFSQCLSRCISRIFRCFFLLIGYRIFQSLAVRRKGTLGSKVENKNTRFKLALHFNQVIPRLTKINCSAD